jgi:lactoylglutathione lyase
MALTFAHAKTNSFDLEKSLAFYRDALDLELVRTVEGDGGSFKLAFLQGAGSSVQIELTWNRGRTEPYDLGENTTHVAFVTDDFDAIHARHAAMGVIAFENPDMGIYFIVDPDGYWIEIIPVRG